MNISIINNTLREAQGMGKSLNLSRLKTNLARKRDIIIGIIKKRKKSASETFIKVMMKISIIKLALTMIALMVMAVLFFSHSHAFAPITLQFSKWVSSPLIGFVVTILIIKFIGISVGLTLTILAARNITIKDVRLRVKELCKIRLRIFLRKKVQPQMNFLNR
jgi:ABC-type phosphate/phosphonate transport system permease subunit